MTNRGSRNRAAGLALALVGVSAGIGSTTTLGFIASFVGVLIGANLIAAGCPHGRRPSGARRPRGARCCTCARRLHPLQLQPCSRGDSRGVLCRHSGRRGDGGTRGLPLRVYSAVARTLTCQHQSSSSWGNG
ncbi:hypothetical protein U9M48_040635 [Paspalum notatum var. saurae]|uniref:Uncharacterized protein n=1 Tax=Paspalum notatum var. saurae TaxID=547442 RepID=A0AAQ3UR23_PASNO